MYYGAIKGSSNLTRYIISENHTFQLSEISSNIYLTTSMIKKSQVTGPSHVIVWEHLNQYDSGCTDLLGNWLTLTSMFVHTIP